MSSDSSKSLSRSAWLRMPNSPDMPFFFTRWMPWGFFSLRGPDGPAASRVILVSEAYIVAVLNSGIDRFLDLDVMRRRDHHLRRDRLRAGVVVVGALREAAGSARHELPQHLVQRVVERRPACHVGPRAHDDAQGAQCRSDVRDAGVVADQ